MSTPGELPTWGKRRWAAAIATVFALQLALVFVLEDRSPAAMRTPEPRFVVGMVMNPATSARLLDTLGLADPTLFPLGDVRGAPKPAWLGFSPVDSQLKESDAAGTGLAQPVSRLGNAFQTFVQTNVATPSAVPDKPVAQPAPQTVAEAPPPGRSTLRFEGELKARSLTEPVQPRSWQHTNLLADSVVQVFVNAAGEVFSPRLVSGGAAKDAVQNAADRHALDVGRALRFKPLPAAGAGYTPGAIVFHWHVTAPPAAEAKPKP